MKHPGHTYGDFVPAISERGMTDAHSPSHPNAKAITWAQFKTSFRAHFVLDGLIRLKKQEFRDLTQGNMSVAEY
jgi:hypothetical protein